MDSICTDNFRIFQKVWWVELSWGVFRDFFSLDFNALQKLSLVEKVFRKAWWWSTNGAHWRSKILVSIFLTFTDTNPNIFRGNLLFSFLKKCARSGMVKAALAKSFLRCQNYSTTSILSVRTISRKKLSVVNRAEKTKYWRKYNLQWC